MGTASAAVSILLFFALKSCAPAEIRPDKLQIGWLAFVPLGGKEQVLRDVHLVIGLRAIRLDTHSPTTAAHSLEPALGTSAQIVDSGVQSLGRDGTARFSVDLKGFPTVSADGKHPENIYASEEMVTVSSFEGQMFVRDHGRSLLTDDQHPRKFYTEWSDMPNQKVAIDHGLQLGFVPPRQRDSPPVGIFVYVRQGS